MITEPEEIVQSLGEADLEPGEGGTVVLRWLNTPEQTVARGTVTAFDPPRAIEFDTIQDVQVGGVSGRPEGVEPRSLVLTGQRRSMARSHRA